ncbi:MAG: RNA pseudouridine synthase [Lachnospiraceae bacterium]|nr:RNA pseudouridine synthase [Lachnospiraceae bacterium]
MGTKTKILYEDHDIIVCHKPAGIAVQSAGIGSMDMVSELKRYMKQSVGDPYLGIIHRLDQPVEGVMVFAKTPKVAAELSKQVALPGDMIHAEEASDKIMKKIYHAEVYGHLPEMSGELKDNLVKDARTNTSYVVGMPESADSGTAGSMRDDRERKGREEKKKESPKFAYLTYKVLERREETDLLEIRLFTGRHHQIRVQFSHAGYPLVGDTKYASKESAEYNQKKSIRGVLLKAVQLEFTHPGSGKRMVFSI